MIRFICASRDTSLPNATAERGALWIDRADVERTTGWAWKSEGLCRDETCVPMPRATDKPITDGNRLEMTALWRYVGWPVVHDSTSQIWVLGEGSTQRAAALTSLQAPDFELPDLDGHLHRLSDYRGRRVFLATWASW
jgi:hypothetical protein